MRYFEYAGCHGLGTSTEREDNGQHLIRGTEIDLHSGTILYTSLHRFLIAWDKYSSDLTIPLMLKAGMKVTSRERPLHRGWTGGYMVSAHQGVPLPKWCKEVVSSSLQDKRSLSHSA